MSLILPENVTSPNMERLYYIYWKKVSHVSSEPNHIFHFQARLPNGLFSQTFNVKLPNHYTTTTLFAQIKILMGGGGSFANLGQFLKRMKIGWTL